MGAYLQGTEFSWMRGTDNARNRHSLGAGAPLALGASTSERGGENDA